MVAYAVAFLLFATAIGHVLVSGEPGVISRSRSPVQQFKSFNRPPSTKERGWKQILVYVGPVQNVKDNDELVWKSSSQIGQDTVINNIFPDPGYFVDLAANHWKDLSNSYSLEVYSEWNGICIEANSNYLEGHKRRRSTYVSAVVGNKDEQVLFSHGNDAFGGIVAEEFDNANADPNAAGVSQFYTVSIEDIFRISDVPQIVHYFSLDVEGAESLVFSHIPFVKFQIYVFTIERPKSDILVQLHQLGYVEVGILADFGDVMYMSKSTPQFLERLKIGQLSIDQIVRGDESSTDTDNFHPNQVKGNSYANGVRCPYNRLTTCGNELLPWDAKYEKSGKVAGRPAHIFSFQSPVWIIEEKPEWKEFTLALDEL